MRLFNFGTLFLTSATLLNSIELSSQARHIVPPPYGNRRPPSYVIENRTVRLTGDSIGSEAVVMDGYFLGTWEQNRFRAVDPFDHNSVILLRTGRIVRVSDQLRSYLILRQAFQSGRLNLIRMRARNRGRGHYGAGPSGARPSGAGPSGAGSSGTGPSGAGSSGAGSSGAGPSGAGPSGTGPSGADSSGAGSSGAGPSGAGPGGSGPSRAVR